MDSTELSNVIRLVRAGEAVELPCRVDGLMASMRLVPPEPIPASGSVIPRLVRVELAVGITLLENGSVPSTMIRPGALLGEQVTRGWGVVLSASDGDFRKKSITIGGKTLSETVRDAVSRWDSEEREAHAHQYSRASAVAAEEAAYLVRLAN